MIPALAVSIASYLHHRALDAKGLNVHLWMSSASAVVAALSKQPALLWLLVALPTLAVADKISRQLPLSKLTPAAFAVCAGLLWLATEGAGFHLNEGVLSRSLEERSWFEQILYAGDRHLIGDPATGFIFALCVYAIYRDRRGRGVFFLLLVPSLLLWFLFGAYEERLGMHIVALATLLTVASSLERGEKDGRVDVANMRPTICYIAYVMASLAVVFAMKIGLSRIESRHPYFSLYDGGKNVIYKYFGDDANFVYREIYRQSKTLWISSNYIYGIFYGHNPIVRPDRHAMLPQREPVKEQILATQPDYLFDATSLGPRIGFWGNSL